MSYAHQPRQPKSTSDKYRLPYSNPYGKPRPGHCNMPGGTREPTQLQCDLHPKQGYRQKQSAGCLRWFSFLLHSTPSTHSDSHQLAILSSKPAMYRHRENGPEEATRHTTACHVKSLLLDKLHRDSDVPQPRASVDAIAKYRFRFLHRYPIYRHSTPGEPTYRYSIYFRL